VGTLKAWLNGAIAQSLAAGRAKLTREDLNDTVLEKSCLLRIAKEIEEGEARKEWAQGKGDEPGANLKSPKRAPDRT
jgi:hypothetical protein